MGKTEHNFAFTLAEVLITLSIIGVVAALTIPSLIVKKQEKETVVRLKKAYNTFVNAYSLAVLEYGEASGWGTASANEGGWIALKNFIPYLNTIKICPINDKSCGQQGRRLYGDLENYDGRAGLILNDGSNASFRSVSKDCMGIWGQSEALKSVCAIIETDTNGQNKPNTMGIDRFGFWMTKKGIIPIGTKDETGAYTIKDCNKKQNGVGCTAWVLTKENMDYLRKEVSWE